MTTTSTKTELSKKVGKKSLLDNDYMLAAILDYVSGIKSFDSYLNGKTLKQMNAACHIIKYPKGLVISIAKLFSSFPFGLADSEIKRTFLNEKLEISNLTFETIDNQNIIFSFKTKNIFEVKQFLNDIHLSFDYNKTQNQGEEKKKEQKQKEKENKENHSEYRQGQKRSEEEQNRQSYNDRSNNGMSIEKAIEILGVKRNASKDEIKSAYRILVKKYNTDQRGSYEEHVRQMLDDKMKEINAAKEFLQKNGFV